MGVTYGFELRGKVDEAHLKQAWKLVQDEFPYARTVVRIAVGEACFVEEPQVARAHLALLPAALWPRSQRAACGASKQAIAPGTTPAV
jgi:hypothetical protein